MVTASHLPRVLVTDAHATSALAAVRSLGRRGMDVTVVGEPHRCNLAAYSRYATRVLTWPSASSEPRAYASALLAELGQRRYDVLVPSTDTTVAIVARCRDRIEPLARVALPPNDVLAAARDKWRTVEEARRADVAVPRTWCCASSAELDAAASAVRFPCVIKPRFSRDWDGNGRIVDGHVRYAGSPRALREIVGASGGGSERLLVQEKVDGQGIGVCVLADRGEVKAIFAHRRLREASPTGSRASLAESIFPDERIAAPARRLIARIGWTGVAMIEFKDPGPPAPPVLMEINGRLWGSLPLSVGAGVDFPLLLVQQTMGLPLEAPDSYAVGVKYRHLKGDLSYVGAVMKGRPRDWAGPFPTPLAAVGAVVSWPGRWRGYNFRFTDPLPGLREAADVALAELRNVRRRRAPLPVREATPQP